jgi:hypothetical protein
VLAKLGSVSLGSVSLGSVSLGSVSLVETLTSASLREVPANMSVSRFSLNELFPIVSPADAGQAGTLDLWWFPYGEVEERTELFDAYAAILTEDEQARHERLRFDRDKRQFLATRALVRTVLSVYSPDVAPTAWRFAIGDRGKPSIAEPISARGWQFNLSNTRGCVV